MPRATVTDVTMHIGELAERTGLSLRTIRHYDEVDLLRPSGRTDGGFRLYTERDLEQLLLIRRMRPLGFSLEQMREMLSVVDQLSSRSPPSREQVALRARLAEFLDTARAKREEMVRQLRMADELIALLPGFRSWWACGRVGFGC